MSEDPGEIRDLPKSLKIIEDNQPESQNTNQEKRTVIRLSRCGGN